MWYRTGSISVTAGSAVITGAGTDFVANVSVGEALLGPDLRVYEIAAIVSATVLTLVGNYQGASGGGQPYAILPTQSFARDLALGAANLLNTFAAVRDGIGQGLIADGTIATPGIRFAADQDTGIARFGANILGLVSGGVASLFASGGSIGIGTTTPLARMHVTTNVAEPNYVLVGNPANGVGIGVQANGLPSILGYSGTGLVFGTNLATVPTEFARFDGSGNLLVGVTSGSNHSVSKASGLGSGVLSVVNSAYFFNCDVAGFSGANTAMRLWSHSGTGRSLNASGTINASGADYAEYMTKADGCGTIGKGDVCGIDRHGLLVRTWSNAVRFVVKSTDPNLVGGDTWAAHLPPRPEAPANAPIAPLMPALPSAAVSMPVEPVREDGEEDAAFIRRMAAYLVQAAAAATTQQADAAMMAAYQADLAAYPKRKAKHDAEVAAYETALASWEADLETARQTVDRIAFCGQVPVNVDGDTLAACEAALADGVAVYLVAVARGAGIGVTAVREGDMTLPLYMRRIGAVWAIREGRPWVDVQHG